jgi:mycothiol synthase
MWGKIKLCITIPTKHDPHPLCHDYSLGELMSEKSTTNNDCQIRDFPKLTFRRFQGDADYSLILSIYLRSNDADHIIDPASLEDMKRWCAPSVRFNPNQDIVFAVVDAGDGASSIVGFSRLSWYTGLKDTRLYVQMSFLHPDWRDHGFWPSMVQQNELRLREIAATHPFAPQRFYQAWATSTQVKWISALESEGYQAVRHFHNMLHRLDVIPEQEMPAGLEVRPVKTEHYRSIWEAQREVQLEIFEVVAENWADDRYESWLANPSHTPQLWQVAWDGDQVVGMVLPRIDEAENRQLERKRGYTEHVFVRRPWRKRGLAKALILRSFRALKEQGMQEAELGVDSENESGAFGFYHRLGYETFSTDIWFRKPMDMNLGAG